MKFIDKNGEVVEGTPLSNEQVKLREHIQKYVHEKVCRGSFHSSYDRTCGGVSCEKVANYFITNFKLTPLDGVDFDKDITAAEAENAPQCIEKPSVMAVKTTEEETF